MATPIAKPLNSILRQLLIGVYDEDSPLHKLIGLRHVLRSVWKQVRVEWKRCILTYRPRLNYVLHSETRQELDFDPGVEYEEGAFCQSKRYRPFEFPKFTGGININMMPFIMGMPFDESRLPQNLYSYYENLLLQCEGFLSAEEVGKIGFLTIHESEVEPNTSQRRTGIHTEKSRKIFLTEDGHLARENTLGGEASFNVQFVFWGLGYIMRKDVKKFKGGIYMATNVENSSKIWNCKILDHPNDGEEIIGPLGDVSHLEHLFPSGEIISANRLYWMTDRTPHESLPVAEGAKRQFFRLVTSQVSVWYEEHNTPNPTGLVPDPAITKIVKGSKFA